MFSYNYLFFLSRQMAAPDPEKNPSDDHKTAQRLAHGKRTENKTELRVRLPEKFHDKSEYTVKNKKCGQHTPLRPITP